jgi:hypothetical protein
MADALLRLHEQHMLDKRHYDSQRMNITNFLAALTAGILSVLAINDFTAHDWPLTVLVAVVGLFGIGFSWKQYERWHSAHTYAKEFALQLDRLCGDALIANIRASARQKAKANHPLLWRLKLGHYWIMMNGFVALLGIVLTLMIVLGLIPPKSTLP